LDYHRSGSQRDYLPFAGRILNLASPSRQNRRGFRVFLAACALIAHRLPVQPAAGTHPCFGNRMLSRRKAPTCARGRMPPDGAGHPCSRAARMPAKESGLAWAKPDALLICGNCYDDGEGEICLMIATPAQEAEAA